MTTFLTGGTGFIGQHVTSILQRQGERLHMLVRSANKADPDTGRNVQLFVGDVTDLDSVMRAMEGCTRVIHLAAHAKVWTKETSTYERVNASGTCHVLDAAIKFNVDKVVFASSCTAIGLRSGEIPDERAIFTPELFTTPYACSKHMAEKQVELFLQKGLKVITVYPSRVFGPGDLSGGNAATKMISMYMQRRLPFMIGEGETIANWAYVKDVAQGIVCSLERGRSGERYFLGGQNVSHRQILDMIDAISGHTRFKMPLSKELSLKIARFEEWKASLLGVAPLITPGWVEALSQNSPLICTKAERELGYNITDLQTALEETVTWLMTCKRQSPSASPATSFFLHSSDISMTSRVSV